MAYNPDGKHLATASLDGTVQVYALGIRELLNLARSRVTRDFTPDECKRLWSAKIPSGGFQRNVTLLHSDRLPSEALCCAKIPSYFEALTDPRDKPIRLTFI